ncbi:MAG: DMT family transporter [Candidatus Hinthialibacter antarcticus]|nr:DMT family transporter [Candidatus Hinthialibacter antarcticus]
MSNQNRSWVLGIICVIGAQFLFGTTFAFNKWVMNHNIDPIALGFARASLASVFMAPFFWSARNTTRWTPKDWRRVVFIGLGLNAVAIICEYMGTNFTSASNATLIIATESVFSVFLAVIILKETLHKQTVVGGVIALAGVALVMFRDIMHFEVHGGAGLFGDALVVASVVCWGLFTILSKKLLNHSNPIYTLFFINIFASISLGIVSGTQGTLAPMLEMDAYTWAAVLYLGLICSGGGFLLYFTALKLLPASIVVLTLTLIPVFGVVFSIGLLGEVLTLPQIIGGTSIICGVTYAMWPREAQKVVSEDALIGP